MSKMRSRPSELSALRIVEKKDAPDKNRKALKLNMVRVQKTAKRGSRPSLLMYTLYFLYKNLYILGIGVIRRKRHYVRRVRLFLKRRRGSLYAGMFRASEAGQKALRRIVAWLNAPFLRIRNAYREQKPIIQAKREKGIFPFAAYLEVVEAVLRLFRRIIATIVNHVLPVGALLVLAFIINGFINQSFGLRVIYKGEEIGYIKSEADFDAASRDVQSRVIEGTNYTFPTDIPSFELVICENRDENNRWILLYNDLLKRAGIEMVELERFTPVGDLANTIVEMSGQAVQEAYGLYIDNRLIGVVAKKEGILNQLEHMRTSGMSGKPGERVEFEKRISFNPGLYLESTLVEEEELISQLTDYEQVEQIYIVQENDTPTEIAEKTGITYSRLKEMNPDIEENLMPGDEILTAVARPFLTIKSIYTDVYQEDIPYETEEIQNAIYAVGYREPEREGKNGVREVTAEITTINGIEASREEISSQVLVPPVAERVIVGVNVPVSPPVVTTPVTPDTSDTPDSSSGLETTEVTPPPASTPSIASSGFMWPVSSGYVSVGLGGYPGHTGVDIAGPAGTPIYASAAGTVVKANRTYYGYGIHCVIDHGGGYTTLYAHMSDMYVSVGTPVGQGQIIGVRGRTGNASGNHLHFEVRVNGSIKDPLNYISQ